MEFIQQANYPPNTLRLLSGIQNKNMGQGEVCLQISSIVSCIYFRIHLHFHFHPWFALLILFALSIYFKLFVIHIYINSKLTRWWSPQQQGWDGLHSIQGHVWWMHENRMKEWMNEQLNEYSIQSIEGNQRCLKINTRYNSTSKTQTTQLKNGQSS